MFRLFPVRSTCGCTSTLMFALMGVLAASAAPTSDAIFQLRLVAEPGAPETELFVLHRPGREDKMLYVEKAIAFDRSAIKSAVYAEDIGNMRGMVVTLTEEAAKRFADFSAQHIKRRMAIIVSGRLIMAPTIRERISRGELKITAAMSPEEAKELVATINAAVAKP